MSNEGKHEKDKEAAEKDISKTDSLKKTEKQQSQVQQVLPSGKSEAPDSTGTIQPVANAEPQDWLGSNRDPDVMLSVPNLGIDHIGLNVKNLHAHLDLQAEVLDLLKLQVGADVRIEEVDLQIDNVRVQAMLKVKLEQVQEIIEDLVGLLDKNPEILSNLTGGLGKGLEGKLSGKHGDMDQLSEQEKTALRKMPEDSDKSDINQQD